MKKTILCCFIVLTVIPLACWGIVFSAAANAVPGTVDAFRTAIGGATVAGPNGSFRWRSP